MTEERSRDIAVNGTTLRLTTWGEYTTPERAVLLVHGLTANHRCWVGLGPHLAARGWYAIAPDLRGRGKSGRPPHGYGLPYHAHDLLALCDALDLPTVRYVGHSLGALIGLFVGAVHPERLGRLVLVDAGGRLPDDTVSAIGAALARLGTVYPSLDAYLDAMRSAMPVPWDGFWEGYFRYDAEAHPGGGVISGVSQAAIAEELRVMGMVRTEDLPASVTTPTLLVRATRGLLGPERGLLLPRDEAERLRGLIAGCRVLEFEGTNHYTIIQDERFADAVASFLEDATAG